MIENAERRLSEDKSDRSIIDVVREAAIEVRKPTMFGELIIMIVYLPILALEGVEGKLFRPMALTVVFALLGSMALSLTLMPVLASFSLKPGKVEHEPWLIRRLKAIYRPVLSFALRRRTAVMAIALACLLASALGWAAADSEMRFPAPEFKGGYTFPATTTPPPVSEMVHGRSQEDVFQDVLTDTP